MFKNDRELLEYVLAALRTAEENACDLPASYRGSYLEGAISQIEVLIEAHCNRSFFDRGITHFVEPLTDGNESPEGKFVEPSTVDSQSPEGKSLIDQAIWRFIYGAKEGETE